MNLKWCLSSIQFHDIRKNTTWKCDKDHKSKDQLLIHFVSIDDNSHAV